MAERAAEMSPPAARPRVDAVTERIWSRGQDLLARREADVERVKADAERNNSPPPPSRLMSVASAAIIEKRTAAGDVYVGPVSGWERRFVHYMVSKNATTDPSLDLTFAPTINPDSRAITHSKPVGDRLFDEANERRSRREELRAEAEAERAAITPFAPFRAIDAPAPPLALTTSPGVPSGAASVASRRRCRAAAEADAELTFAPEISKHSAALAAATSHLRPPLYDPTSGPRAPRCRQKARSSMDASPHPSIGALSASGKSAKPRTAADAEEAFSRFYKRQARFSEKSGIAARALRELTEMEEGEQCSFRPRLNATSVRIFEESRKAEATGANVVRQMRLAAEEAELQELLAAQQQRQQSGAAGSVSRRDGSPGTVGVASPAGSRMADSVVGAAARSRTRVDIIGGYTDTLAGQAAYSLAEDFSWPSDFRSAQYIRAPLAREALAGSGDVGVTLSGGDGGGNDRDAGTRRRAAAGSGSFGDDDPTRGDDDTRDGASVRLFDGVPDGYFEQGAEGDSESDDGVPRRYVRGAAAAAAPLRSLGMPSHGAPPTSATRPRANVPAAPRGGPTATGAGDRGAGSTLTPAGGSGFSRSPAHTPLPGSAAFAAAGPASAHLSLAAGLRGGRPAGAMGAAGGVLSTVAGDVPRRYATSSAAGSSARGGGDGTGARGGSVATSAADADAASVGGRSLAREVDATLEQWRARLQQSGR